jgi:hypothetical protein
MFTLQTRGLISLNQAAFEALGKPAAVALLYDADQGVVALRTVEKNYQNAYTVRKQGGSRSYLVAAQGFTTYYKLPTEVSRRYTGRDYGKGIWGFALGEGTPVKVRGAPRSP